MGEIPPASASEVRTRYEVNAEITRQMFAKTDEAQAARTNKEDALAAMFGIDKESVASMRQAVEALEKSVPLVANMNKAVDSVGELSTAVKGLVAKFDGSTSVAEAVGGLTRPTEGEPVYVDDLVAAVESQTIAQEAMSQMLGETLEFHQRSEDRQMDHREEISDKEKKASALLEEKTRKALRSSFSMGLAGIVLPIAARVAGKFVDAASGAIQAARDADEAIEEEKRSAARERAAAPAEVNRAVDISVQRGASEREARNLARAFKIKGESDIHSSMMEHRVRSLQAINNIMLERKNLSQERAGDVEAVWEGLQKDLEKGTPGSQFESVTGQLIRAGREGKSAVQAVGGKGVFRSTSVESKWLQESVERTIKERIHRESIMRQKAADVEAEIQKQIVQPEGQAGALAVDASQRTAAAVEKQNVMIERQGAAAAAAETGSAGLGSVPTVLDMETDAAVTGVVGRTGH